MIQGREAATASAATASTGGVTHEAWANAAKHYDEDQLAALVSLIAFINAFNRVNVIVQQPAGDYRPASSTDEGYSPAGR